jgi:hypothetical protein
MSNISIFSSYRMLLDLLSICTESRNSYISHNVQMRSLFQWIEKAINVCAYIIIDQPKQLSNLHPTSIILHILSCDMKVSNKYIVCSSEAKEEIQKMADGRWPAGHPAGIFERR